MEITKKKNYLLSLSQELLCHILSYLPLKQVLLIGTLNKNLLKAVELHLRLLKEIDFCESEVIGFMPIGITDKHILALLRKCPNVEIIRGLHPVKLDRWRLHKANTLSVSGIVDALTLCPCLREVETSNFRLLEAFSQHLPQLEIAGHFRNRDGMFPPQPNNHIKLSPFLKLTSLHLMGVQVPELTIMTELQHLHLQWVSFTRLHPFRSFSALKLQTFVMKHCIGPSVPLRYYPLFIALGCAQNLSRLEIVRVPILGGMIHRSVEEALRNNGFKKITKLVVGDCKGVMESDLGQLMIASSQSLEALYVQASLTKDSLFVSLHFARCEFPHLKTMHLGYVDAFPPRGEWPNDTLLSYGIADIPDVPSSITDSGLKTISQLFPNVQNLTITNCHHIVSAEAWVPEGASLWDNLTCLILERCHSVRLPSFAAFLSGLERIDVLVLKNMFREPPKGCSHVGLSAGTGLGLSSAIVSTQDEHIAVQGHHVEAVPENENGDDVMEHDVEDGMDVMHLPEEEQNIGRQNVRNWDHQEVERNLNAGPSDNIDYGPSCSSHTGSHRSRKSNSKNLKRIRTSRKCTGRSSKQKAINKVKKAKKASELCDRTSSGCYTGPVTRQRSNKMSHKTNQNHCHSVSSQSRTASNGKKAKRSVKSGYGIVDSNYTGPVTRQRSKVMPSTHGMNASSMGKATNSSRAGSSLQKRDASYKSKSLLRRRRNVYNHADQVHCEKKCNKASSTNEPYIEEDVTLVFHVMSQSLLSMTVISCGISEITIDRCSSLTHFEAQACRILKKIGIIDSQSVMKINISECPKLNIAHFISEVMNIYSKNPVVVCFEPYIKNHNYNPCVVEETVFHNISADHSVCVLHDYGGPQRGDVVAQENLLTWLQFLKSAVNEVYPLMLINRIKTKTASSEDISCKYYWNNSLLNRSSNSGNSKYPWGHYLDRILGMSKKCMYELLTNNPIFAALWRKRENSLNGAWFHSSLFNQAELSSSLTADVAELVECGSTIGNYYIGFYINVERSSHNS